MKQACDIGNLITVTFKKFKLKKLLRVIKYSGMQRQAEREGMAPLILQFSVSQTVSRLCCFATVTHMRFEFLTPMKMWDATL